MNTEGLRQTISQLRINTDAHIYDFKKKKKSPNWTYSSSKELSAKENRAATFSVREDLYNIML